MANTRTGLIAALVQAGLSEAEAGQEVLQREAEAERIVASAPEADRKAAVAQARAMLFSPEPRFVRPASATPPAPPVERQPIVRRQPLAGPPSARASSAAAAIPGRPNSSTSEPRVRDAGRQPIPPASPDVVEERARALGNGADLSLEAPAGPNWRLVAIVGAIVAAVLVVGYLTFASGDDDDPFKTAALSGNNGAAPGQQAAGSTQNSQIPGGAVPSGQVSPELQNYGNQLQPILFAYTTSLEAATRLAAAPKLGDSAWTSQVNAEAQKIKDNSAKLKALKPPSCLTAVHANLLKAVESLDKGAQAMLDSAKNNNASTLGQATAAFASANPGLNQATIDMSKARC